MAGTKAHREGKEIESRARAIFAGHLMRPLPSRAYSFRKPSGGSAYGFTVTWSPGVVCLTGDLGTLTLRHPNALAGFEDGMEWLAESDFEYLMGKAIPNVELPDPDGTYERIVGDANAQSLEHLSAHREERAQTRRWEIEDGEPAGRHPYDSARSDDAIYVAWSDLAKAMAARRGPVDADVRSPRDRARLRRFLLRFLREAKPHQTSELCRDLGHVDWYGETQPDSAAYWQITALQRAARELKPTIGSRPALADRLAGMLRRILPTRSTATAKGV